MIIKNKLMNLGNQVEITYHDVDQFDSIPYDKCTQVYGLCFFKNKLVIGFESSKREWVLIGGSIEPGETFEQTLIREVKEESNMRVIKYWPVGFQHILPLDVCQLRYCCIVEPFGPFASDPDGDISEIKFIKPQNFTDYINWGKIGDRLIARSLELIKADN